MGDQRGRSDGTAILSKLPRIQQLQAGRIGYKAHQNASSLSGTPSQPLCATPGHHAYQSKADGRPTMSDGTTRDCCVEVTRAAGARSAATDGFTSASSSKSRLNLACRGLGEKL